MEQDTKPQIAKELLSELKDAPRYVLIMLSFLALSLLLGYAWWDVAKISLSICK